MVYNLLIISEASYKLFEEIEKKDHNSFKKRMMQSLRELKQNDIKNSYRFESECRKIQRKPNTLSKS